MLQVHGVKHWRIYDSPVRLPDRSLPHHTERDKLGPPLYELDINPGDLIYLPRGFVHEALTSDEESLHITVGIIAYTWFDVFTEVLAACRRQDYRFRESLPAGFAEQPQITPAMRETFRQLTATLVENADVNNAIEKVAARFVSSRQPLLEGALSSAHRVEAITPASAVKRRTEIIFLITRDQETITLSFHGKKVQLPLYTEPSVRFIAATTMFAVRDIPGEIDDAGKVVLVRSLLREGFLTLDD